MPVGLSVKKSLNSLSCANCIIGRGDRAHQIHAHAINVSPCWCVGASEALQACASDGAQASEVVPACRADRAGLGSVATLVGVQAGMRLGHHGVAGVVERLADSAGMQPCMRVRCLRHRCDAGVRRPGAGCAAAVVRKWMRCVEPLAWIAMMAACAALNPAIVDMSFGSLIKPWSTHGSQAKIVAMRDREWAKTAFGIAAGPATLPR